jgi:hypothetical protein
MGAGVICPQYNTYFMDDEDIGYEMFMEADYQMIKRACDAVLMLPRWEESKGACNERQLAFDNNIPVFYHNKLEQLEAWIAAPRVGLTCEGCGEMYEECEGWGRLCRT